MANPRNSVHPRLELLVEGGGRIEASHDRSERDAEDLVRLKARIIGEEPPLCPRKETDLHHQEQTQRNGPQENELKSRVVQGYYTSEIGIKQEMEYKGNSYLGEFVGFDVS